MIKNYFLTAVRAFRKSPLFAVVNTIGLSIAIAFFILVAVFVRDELSYDKFHTNVDNIYRGLTENKRGQFIFGIPDKAIDLAVAQLPEVERATSVSFGSRAVLEFEGKKIFEPEYYQADAELFNIFDFSLMFGNPEEALATPENIIVSKYIMDKYYDGENPIGQTIHIFNEDKAYVIAGVLNEIPKNSRFQFNFIRAFDKQESPSEWNGSGQMFALLNDQADPSRLAEKMMNLAAENGYKGAEFNDFLIEPYGDLYLYSAWPFTASGINGDAQLISIFSIIAIVLLAIASINYVNSSTARILSRTHEIGMRKVLGASKRNIHAHFLIEAMLLTLLAVCVAAGMAEAMMPKLNELTNKELSLQYFGDPFVPGLLLGILVFVTVLSGLYPAIFAGQFSPLSSGSTSFGKRALLRKSLIVFQFVATLSLIFSSQIINNQLNMMLSADVGFDPEGILVVPLPKQESYSVIKSSFEGVAGVESVFSSPFPGRFSSSLIDHTYVLDNGEKDAALANAIRVSKGFVEAVGIKVIKGRSFDENDPSDVKNGVMINETLAAKLPWSDPMGKKLTTDTYQGKEEREIIGVFADLKPSLKFEASPGAMVITEDFYRVNLKISETDQGEIVDDLRETWSTLYPDTPMQVVYMEDRIKAAYTKERKFGQIFLYFTYIAIVIAVIGLMGLSAYTTVQKYKEIGIRKVLGGSVSGLVFYLFKSYLLLVVIAAAIAIPAGYFFMDGWLADFVQRVSISPMIFLAGLAMGVMILAAAVGFQTLKAARLNPVDILRNE